MDDGRSCDRPSSVVHRRYQKAFSGGVRVPFSESKSYGPICQLNPCLLSGGGVDGQTEEHVEMLRQGVEA